MANLVTITKSTRGKNAREISFEGIGKFVTRVVEKESDADGKPLGKDDQGKLITRKVEVEELVTDGVLTTLDEANEIVKGNTQMLLDCFAIGFNEKAYDAVVGADELDNLFAMITDEEKLAAIKRATRAFAKAMNLSVLEAAEKVIQTML